MLWADYDGIPDFTTAPIPQMWQIPGMLAPRMLLASFCLASLGCASLSTKVHLSPKVQRPIVHNPFPQLHKVAVAPFFNLSTEPTVDGREFALAYFGELQQISGFQVVPIGVVEMTMRQSGITLESPDEARRLAQLLGVDAVVVGAVTDFSPYAPRRCGLRVEWYAANPCLHEIPPGYGLPWGTPEEELIPQKLRAEAEFAVARAALADAAPTQQAALESEVELAAHETPLAAECIDGDCALSLDPAVDIPVQCANEARGACEPWYGPVMQHTAFYNAQDDDFVQALQTYYRLQHDFRPGGWRSYLQRSSDFARFCCRLHVYAMISARGGADQTRVFVDAFGVR